MSHAEEQDTTRYAVVINHEEQYSIWPAEQQPPVGWKTVGHSGSKSACLDYIEEVWTDMRPLSLRQYMQEVAAHPPEELELQPDGEDAAPELVTRLSDGDHPVEASLRPERTVEALQAAIERQYVHVQFTDTRGGTELGFPLDRQASNLDAADFAAGTGQVCLVGTLVLDFVRVRCTAHIDLSTLRGMGRLERIADEPPANAP